MKVSCTVEKAATRRVRVSFNESGTDLYGLPVKAGGRVFYSMAAAGGAGAALWVDEGASGSRALLDVAASIAADARLGAYVPSPDGRIVAVLIRRHQSNWQELRLFDVGRGELLRDRLLNLHSLSGRVAWRQDGAGFFYTAFDAPKGTEAISAARNARVFYHLIGTSHGHDRQIDGLPKREGWLYTPVVSDDGHWLVVTAAKGSSQRNEIYVARLDHDRPRLDPLITDVDAALTFLGTANNQFFFYTDFNAERGRVVAVDGRTPGLAHWAEIVPQQTDAIAAHDQTGGNALGMYGDRFVLTYLRDGQPYVAIHDISGRLLRKIELPTAGAIWGGFSGDSLIPTCSTRSLG